MRFVRACKGFMRFFGTVVVVLLSQWQKTKISEIQEMQCHELLSLWKYLYSNHLSGYTWVTFEVGPFVTVIIRCCFRLKLFICCHPTLHLRVGSVGWSDFFFFWWRSVSFPGPYCFGYKLGGRKNNLYLWLLL